MSIISHFLKNSHGCQPGKQKLGVLSLGELSDAQGPTLLDLDVIAPQGVGGGGLSFSVF